MRADSCGWHFELTAAKQLAALAETKKRSLAMHVDCIAAMMAMRAALLSQAIRATNRFGTAHSAAACSVNARRARDGRYLHEGPCAGSALTAGCCRQHACARANHTQMAGCSCEVAASAKAFLGSLA